MDDVVIDTHIAIWYFADATQLSKPAENAIDKAEANGFIFVSAITIVELIYLTEKGRIPGDILDLLRDAIDDSTTAFRLFELSREVADEVDKYSASNRSRNARQDHRRDRFASESAACYERL